MLLRVLYFRSSSACRPPTGAALSGPGRNGPPVGMRPALLVGPRAPPLRRRPRSARPSAPGGVGFASASLRGRGGPRPTSKTRRPPLASRPKRARPFGHARAAPLGPSGLGGRRARRSFFAAPEHARVCLSIHRRSVPSRSWASGGGGRAGPLSPPPALHPPPGTPPHGLGGPLRVPCRRCRGGVIEPIPSIRGDGHGCPACCHGAAHSTDLSGSLK